MGDFQNILKNLRMSRGYTQAEFADALNISRSRIGMYETGAREPDFETLEMIADFSRLLKRSDPEAIEKINQIRSVLENESQ